MGQENTQTDMDPRYRQGQAEGERHKPQRSQSDSEGRRFGEEMETGDVSGENNASSSDAREFFGENQYDEDEQTGEARRNNSGDMEAQDGGLFGNSNDEEIPRNREGLI